MMHATLRTCSLAAAALWLTSVAQAEPPAPTAPSEPEAGTPAAGEETPPADEAETPAAEPTAASASSDEVVRRMDALMDRMVQARTRLAVLGEALYATRVSIALDHRVEAFRVEAVRLFLDGAPVYEGDGQGLLGGEAVVLHAGFAAPGMHDLRLEVDQVSKEDGRYGYTLEQRFRFRAVEDQRTDVRIRMDDDSDIAEDFEDDQDGEYDVRTRMRVRSEPLEES